METFLSRYRNLSVLLLLLVGQLVLLAYQVKGQQDVRLIRVWAVTAVTPMARGIEWVRDGVSRVFENVFVLGDVRTENARLKKEMGALKLRNYFLEAELGRADRAKALVEFRSQIPSKTIPAHVVGTGTGANSQVVYVDRGTVDGLKKGMAAIVPEGIVGRVIAAYPMASLVQLITDQGAVAGVISQKNKVRGTLKGKGLATCSVEYVQNEDKLEAGEWFYTSGTDRIFPRGLPVGAVKMVREGRGGKEVIVTPSGIAAGVEELLIVLDGVHMAVPEAEVTGTDDLHMLLAPPAAPNGAEAAQPVTGTGGASTDRMLTDADALREKYRRSAESQGIVIGTSPGRAPDFNKPAPTQPPPAAETKAEAPAGQAPAAAKPGAVPPAPGKKQ